MNAIEILINYSKLRTVQNLVYNIDLVTDIIKDDVYKIAKSKRIYFYDFDFAYSCSVEIIKKQLLKKHLQAIQRFFNFYNLENALKWLMSRILNNMRNITTNKNFKLFIDFKISNFEYEVYADNDDFEKMIQILDIQKLDKSIIKKAANLISGFFLYLFKLESPVKFIFITKNGTDFNFYNFVIINMNK